MPFEKRWDKVIKLRMKQSTYDRLRTLLRGEEAVTDLIRSGIEREIDARSAVMGRKGSVK